MSEVLQKLNIVSAKNDLLFTEKDFALIDLFCGGGSVFLGHANPAIVPSVETQARSFWNVGPLNNPARTQAAELVESFFPDTHAFRGFYSTGMEVAEFALRVVRAATGKKGVVSFSNSMHGKSLATAHMGWENGEAGIPGLTRLSNFPSVHEDSVLDSLHKTFRQDEIGAVIIEPLLASGGGHSGSKAFYHRVSELCKEFGAFLVCDEILTGFYRTGTVFRHQDLGIHPDIVLVGKAMGNGFPVSAIVMRNDISIVPQMLPGSTFAGNPLASAAIGATLSEMKKIPIGKYVETISNTIESNLSGVGEFGIQLRGSGALWFLEFPSATDATNATETLVGMGVFAGSAGKILRLMPPATITHENLESACEKIMDVCAHA